MPSLISIEEARRTLGDAVRPIDRTETVALHDAAGRIVAGDVLSDLSVPAFARSVMDGYAVLASDTRTASPNTPVTLRIVDRIHAGMMPRMAIVSGSCAAISTGAPVPHGADAVVMIEDTEAAGDGQVRVMARVDTGRHISPAGADIAKGDVVLKRGDVLNPGRLGAAAAIGKAALHVYAKPRVAILSTGAEIVPPGTALTPGTVYDINRFTLSAIIEAHGGMAVAHPPVGDTLEMLIDALDACHGADLIVCSGGSSVGERDLIAEAVAARGTMIFHGIAVRPGKPTAFARIGDVPLFGMPGNPTSCLSNAYVLLVPFLRAMARLPRLDPKTLSLPLARRVTGAAGRHTFYTVRIQHGAAVPAFKGSGDITSLSGADGYIEIPAGQPAVEAGTLVTVTLF